MTNFIKKDVIYHFVTTILNIVIFVFLFSRYINNFIIQSIFLLYLILVVIILLFNLMNIFRKDMSKQKQMLKISYIFPIVFNTLIENIFIRKLWIHKRIYSLKDSTLTNIHTDMKFISVWKFYNDFNNHKEQYFIKLNNIKEFDQDRRKLYKEALIVLFIIVSTIILMFTYLHLNLYNLFPLIISILGYFVLHSIENLIHRYLLVFRVLRLRSDSTDPRELYLLIQLGAFPGTAGSPNMNRLEQFFSIEELL